VDNQLKEHASNAHKTRVWYNISDKSKKKLWILLLVVIACSIAAGYVLATGCLKGSAKTTKVN